MSKTKKKIRIRDARLEDAKVLAAAERAIAETPGFLASRPHELKDEPFRDKISDLSKNSSGKYVVIESNENIVGHAFLEPFKLETTKHVVELTIAIHQGFQGQGLGKVLLTYLINWAKANPNIEKIQLHVRSSNKFAISLYERMGFKIEGVRVKQLKISHEIYLDNIAMGLWVGT